MYINLLISIIHLILPFMGYNILSGSLSLTVGLSLLEGYFPDYLYIGLLSLAPLGFSLFMGSTFLKYINIGYALFNIIYFYLFGSLVAEGFILVPLFMIPVIIEQYSKLSDISDILDNQRRQSTDFVAYLSLTPTIKKTLYSYILKFFYVFLDIYYMFLVFSVFTLYRFFMYQGLQVFQSYGYLLIMIISYYSEIVLKFIFMISNSLINYIIFDEPGSIEPEKL